MSLQGKLDKLLEGYLDNLIDEESYKTKKEELINQKNSLKHEKGSLLKTRTASWIEPTRDFVKTLVQAKTIASSESLQEIPQFLQKIGTNRLISAKTISFDFREPYASVADFLHAIPNPAGGSAGGILDPHTILDPLLLGCSVLKIARTYYHKYTKKQDN